MTQTSSDLRSIRLADDGWAIEVLDQRLLPHEVKVARVDDLENAARSISEMWVRGAPLIGATAAYGMALAMRQDPSDAHLKKAREILMATRPTAVNLAWALDRMEARLRDLPAGERQEAAYREAASICDDEEAYSLAIGDAGAELFANLEKIKKERGDANPLQVLTHCNTGWLATVEWGTALACIYRAHAAGVNLHVWVDETRPRNQGANLTLWELMEKKIPCTLIADNSGGHLMQHGLVDVCVVGADRITKRGDACNKIGTYLKALAARDNQVPFYVAAPSSTIDWTLSDGVREIPIEMRSEKEVTHMRGRLENGEMVVVNIAPENAVARNDAFDVTPAHLVDGIITERGVCAANEKDLQALFFDGGRA
jgi:methylthioribose-1-phosphate isomerase